MLEEKDRQNIIDFILNSSSHYQSFNDEAEKDLMTKFELKKHEVNELLEYVSGKNFKNTYQDNISSFDKSNYI